MNPSIVKIVKIENGSNMQHNLVIPYHYKNGFFTTYIAILTQIKEKKKQLKEFMRVIGSKIWIF
jgi:hypothetical protein